MRREVEILYHLGGDHNITQMRGAYEDRMSVHLVMELCSGGELFDRIVSKGHYRWVFVRCASPCKIDSVYGPTPLSRLMYLSV